MSDLRLHADNYGGHPPELLDGLPGSHRLHELRKPVMIGPDGTTLAGRRLHEAVHDQVALRV